ncbi:MULTISPECIES: alpha-amylase family glycosyl hydrolase [Nostoc]|uniref:Alpha-amylase n=1 Tax=Nostoc paludosum FACHB-159 TaxID=2692908 RepID=A0ABR8KB08_9NOSO|nr:MULTISPECIES: alpha-amylase family glycosyl hydrolase [Nostoc]MBD2680268.1 alpha-amylase [Nostoc sp. FACHB-857]MBD2735894.1 alpha-amylase [Nostoc paludosum FACHB-159]
MAKVEEFAPQKLSDTDLKPRGRVQLSPVSWRDQFLYHLLPDRFSDDNESHRELFDRINPLRFQVKNKADWIAASTKFLGGTFRGIRSKLDYLQGLGVTTLWINSPWRQLDLETDNNHSIQNFLDIDPHLGTCQDLRDLIDAAHDRRMYVILDVISNHSGNDWFYRDEMIANLARVYQYWIALVDCDGFCIKTTERIPPQNARKFCTAIREYAQSIGKDNFLLTGKINSDNMADAYLDIFGCNLSAVLDIASAPDTLTSMAKGLADPCVFFDLYSESHLAGQCRQDGLYHVSILDDDISSANCKQRFAVHSDVPNLYEQVANVVGVQLTMPGIPAIYYGTEQAFDGNVDNLEDTQFATYKCSREAMFGGDFGAFQTAGCHFFNPDHPTYLRIAAIARLRNQHDKIGKALRRGHHILRETSFCNYPFSIPQQGELVAWSQILFDTEVLMVLNTHALENRGAEVTVDAAMHPPDSTMTYLYKSDWSDKQLRYPPDRQTVTVQHYHDRGRASVRIDLPPSCMAILV